MASLIQGFAYDIFISYRQKDNKGDRWVTSFVEALKNELDATFKDEVSIYFDENPHDGLLESHHVDKSLEGKLRSAILIPIVSQTYCDPKSFAWQNEFCVFIRQASADAFGKEVKLHGGNVASRVLPVRINDVDTADRSLFEKESGNVLRSIDFIFKTPGVNRPLTPIDKKEENLNKTIYRDQVNKVANAVKDILGGMREPVKISTAAPARRVPQPERAKSFWTIARERDLGRVALVYTLFSLIAFRLVSDLVLRGTLPIGLTFITISMLALGFPIALWLAWRYEFSPSGIVSTDSSEAKASTFSPSQKRPFTGNIAFLVLVLLVAAQLFFAPATRTSDEFKSIAVLYFDNLSNDPEQEFFTAGITDEISAHLSKIPSLRVTSRTSVLPYKGKEKALNIRKIAEELGVDNILDGSVQKSGNKLHITAQLIEVKTDKSLWSETFDREITEVFSIQSEIARAIAEKFKVRISPDVIAKLNDVPTTNMEAYDLYLKARALPWVTGFGIGTSYEPIKRGAGLMKKAIALDPDFADAYLLLASYKQELGEIDSAILLAKEGVMANPMSASGYRLLATLTGEKKWLKRALTLDTVSGVKEIGWRFWRQDNKPFALRCFMEAHRRVPNDVPLLVGIASCYNWMAQMDSVTHYINLAKQIDPKSRDILEFESTLMRFYIGPEKWKLLGAAYFGDDSLGYYKELGVAYLYARKWKEAEAAYAKTAYRDLDWGLVMIKTGREDSGRNVMRQSLRWLEAHPGGWVGNYARIHAVLGNRDKALEYYRKIQLGGMFAHFFKIDPFTDYIRDDPGYKQIEMESEKKLNAELQQIREAAGKPFPWAEVMETIR